MASPIENFDLNGYFNNCLETFEEEKMKAQLTSHLKNCIEILEKNKPIQSLEEHVIKQVGEEKKISQMEKIQRRLLKKSCDGLDTAIKIEEDKSGVSPLIFELD